MAPWKPRISVRSGVAVRCVTVGALGLFAASALAQSGLDYRSIGASATIFYNAPSPLARKVAVVSRYYPVEVLIASGEWLKVRDSAGDLAWVESKNLSSKRMVIVSVASAQMRQKPEANSAGIAQIERNVVLEFIDYVPGWVKVRHRDGLIGYLPITELWGA